MNAWRIFFCVEKLGRIPHIGNAGFTYVTPILERQFNLLKDSSNGIGLNNKTRAELAALNSCRFQGKIIRRHYSSVTTSQIKKSDEERLSPKKKPKTLESPKIMLITDTHAKSVTTLEEAYKFATRKGLHLIPVQDKAENNNLTEKPIYKLVTNAEYIVLEKVYSEEVSNDSNKQRDDKKKDKEIKTMMLKSTIADHDALSKIKQMNKMIDKGHTIKVMIGHAGEKGNSETVYKLLETTLKETGIRFVQKVVKGNQIRFHLMAPKEPKQSNKKSSNENNAEESKELKLPSV